MCRFATFYFSIYLFHVIFFFQFIPSFSFSLLCFTCNKITQIFIFHLQDSTKRQQAHFVPCITVSLDPSLTLRLNNLQHAVNVSYWDLILTAGDPRFLSQFEKQYLQSLCSKLQLLRAKECSGPNCPPDCIFTMHVRKLFSDKICLLKF